MSMEDNVYGTLGVFIYMGLNSHGIPSRLIYRRVNEHDTPVHIDIYAG